jgi:2-phosphosulfolactate phosphatase
VVRLAPDPEPIPPVAAAVVVDVLRATSTLAVALENGAARIVPAADPAAALALQRRHPEALLCGERDGRKIPGFHLGNSPAEYAPEVVAGRTLIFASTNGSRAILAAAPAQRRWLGSFVNATATLEALDGAPEVLVVCAGKEGGFSLEDAAFAGWLCLGLVARGGCAEGPEAAMARTLAPRDRGAVLALLQGAAQGRHLRTLGADYARDLEWCARLDAVPRAFAV